MSRFNVGDKVRCINDFDQGSSSDTLVVGTCYIVEYADTAGFIRLFGCLDAWYESRFELVQAAPNYHPGTLVQQLPTQSYRQGSGIAAMADEVMTWGMDSTLPIMGTLKCECGVDSIGGGRHSDYCPKHD